MEKSILAAIGKYLSKSGTRDIFVTGMIDYMQQRTFFKGPLVNVVSGEKMGENTKEFYLSTTERGANLYTSYRQVRIVNRTTKLMDKLPQEKAKTKKSQPIVVYDLKKETVKLLRYIDIARPRCFDIKHLLSFEMVSTSFFSHKGQFSSTSGR